MSTEQAAIVLLYVDDEVFTRQMVEMVLREAGFKLVIAANGAKAMALLEARAEAFHGLITGVKLAGGTDGWTVARRARELFSGLPVVYVTGFGSKEWTSHGVPDSIMIAKPFVPAQIVIAMSTLLNAASAESEGESAVRLAPRAG
jgi:DNA-binding response OmpR family regulator